MTKRLRAAPWIGVIAAVAVAGAVAQVQTLTPSETLACLMPQAAQRGTPKYPERSFERREGGRVAVTLDFTTADGAPKVLVTDGGDLGEFKDAVLDHVRRYRVPCLKPGQAARLTQEFSFVPTDARKVRWLAPVDAADERRAQLLRCVVHQSPGTKPDYPQRALRDGAQGTVVLHVVFRSPDAAPTIAVVDDGLDGSLAKSAVQFAGGYRMPCHEGDPVSTTHLYKFRIQDGAYVTFNDVSLISFLRVVKGIKQAQAYFDFKEMGCPFDVRFVLNQPYSPNGVGEVGAPMSARSHFLDWLRRQELDLPRQTHNAVLGQITTVSVPCTVLDLGTTAGGGASQ